MPCYKLLKYLNVFPQAFAKSHSSFVFVLNSFFWGLKLPITHKKIKASARMVFLLLLLTLYWSFIFEMVRKIELAVIILRNFPELNFRNSWNLDKFPKIGTPSMLGKSTEISAKELIFYYLFQLNFFTGIYHGIFQRF